MRLEHTGYPDKLPPDDNRMEYFKTIPMVMWEYIREKKNNLKAGKQELMQIHAI